MTLLTYSLTGPSLQIAQVTVAKKADSIYKTVSCASIAAKVTYHPTRHNTPSIACPLSPPFAPPSVCLFPPPQNPPTPTPNTTNTPPPNTQNQQVTRDRVIASWTWEEPFPSAAAAPPTDFGSGYPSDQRASDWLSRHLDGVFGFPRLVRFSWSTARELMERNCVPVAWQHEEDEDEGALPPGTASIEAFIKRPAASASASAAAGAAGGGASKKARKRARFFAQRHVEVVGSF